MPDTTGCPDRLRRIVCCFIVDRRSLRRERGGLNPPCGACESRSLKRTVTGFWFQALNHNCCLLLPHMYLSSSFPIFR